MVAFGSILSTYCGSPYLCGVRSWSVDFPGGVSMVDCGCELCLIGVVFVVPWCVGETFLRNLVSPVESSPSSLPSSL